MRISSTATQGIHGAKYLGRDDLETVNMHHLKVIHQKNAKKEKKKKQGVQATLKKRIETGEHLLPG